MSVALRIRPAFLPLLLSASCAGSASEPPATRQKGLTVALGGWSTPRTYDLYRQTLAGFTQETGTRVTYVPAPLGKPRRLKQYLVWLERHSARPDVLWADVTDIGRLAEHVIDLRPYLGHEADQQIPDVINNYVVSGRLLAMPLYTDVGLLFYRPDLLKKYGYPEPPRTWKDLEGMAARIQAGERAAGRSGFWGFVWPGQQSDDLICFGLEVQASWGGGKIIEDDRTISVNNPQAAQALQMIRGWVGTISPPTAMTLGPDDARNIWFAGDAAFLRSWPSTYAVSQDHPAVRGTIDATVLPSGGAGHFGTLGGWQLSVSRYSAYPQEAADLIRYVTRRDQQRKRAIVLSGLPPLLDLYQDSEVLQVNPYFERVKAVFPGGTVARPSAVAGKAYDQVSEAYSQAVHSVVAGEASPAEALAELESRLVTATGFPTKVPGPHARR